MHTLLTALSAFFALLSTFMVWACYRHVGAANEAEVACARAAGKLNAMAGRLIALEGAHEQLRLQHQKLHGKFHAAQREKDSDTPAAQSDVGPAAAGVRTPPPYCQNFQLAQLGGPLCDAAGCECGYCVEMRARRSATKAELLPAARAATLATSRSRE